MVPLLREACRYAVLGGGKRVRPIIVLRCCEACGGDPTAAIDAACAVEFIHAFSLVHDDLPALDDDAVRRGRPTLHRAFTESMAILAGDALFAMGLAVASGIPRGGESIARELMHASLCMIDGQVLDTLPQARAAGASGRELVHAIHSRKTGALIASSARVGALCAHASAPVLDAVSRWGESVGLMFQIVDDWIDVTQPAITAGKATGKDAAASKVTWVATLGVEGARAEVVRLTALALEAVGPVGTAADALRDLTHELADRRA